MWTKKTASKPLYDLVIEQNRVIERLNEKNAELKKKLKDKDDTIKRMNQQLTEKELYEKKKKENAPTGVPAIDATVDRLIKLEAKIEAQENPYFF